MCVCVTKGNTSLLWDSKASSLCDENRPQAEDTTEVIAGLDRLTGAHFSLWGGWGTENKHREGRGKNTGRVGNRGKS